MPFVGVLDLFLSLLESDFPDLYLQDNLQQLDNKLWVLAKNQLEHVVIGKSQLLPGFDDRNILINHNVFPFHYTKIP